MITVRPSRPSRPLSDEGKKAKGLISLLRLVAFSSLIAFMVLMAILAPVYAETIKIIVVEAKKIGNYNEVIVHTSDNIKPEIILLESPNRIALAFPNSKIDKPLTLPGPSQMIRIIQAAQFDENTVYVMVEPNEKLTYEYASIIGRNKFILELSQAKPGSTKVVAPSAPPAEKEIAAAPPVAVPQIAAIPVISAEAVKPTSEIIAVPVAAKPKPAKAAPSLSGITIVIDPGHGGRDPGYVGKTGILEKYLTLKVALKLKQILTEAGAKVLMTRYNDVSTKDKAIVDLANSSKADIFVAIHFNSYTSPYIAGCETYYFTPTSKSLAKVMQKTLARSIKRRNRGIKKVTYYIVHHTKMPSVLVEPVYLTSPKEEKLILSPTFQTRVAYGIYKGIAEYVKIMPHGRSITGSTSVIRKNNAQD